MYLILQLVCTQKQLQYQVQKASYFSHRKKIDQALIPETTSQHSVKKIAKFFNPPSENQLKMYQI